LLLHQSEEVEMWPACMTITITLKAENEYTLVTLEHRALGALPVQATPGWAMPQIQTPAPERQVILNQLPVTGRSTARPIVHHPMYSVEQIWLRDYAARWDSCLDKLQQITAETEGGKAL
jgi:hypothetical protein